MRVTKEIRRGKAEVSQDPNLSEGYRGRKIWREGGVEKAELRPSKVGMKGERKVISQSCRDKAWELNNSPVPMPHHLTLEGYQTIDLSLDNGSCSDFWYDSSDLTDRSGQASPVQPYRVHGGWGIYSMGPDRGITGYSYNVLHPLISSSSDCIGPIGRVMVYTLQTTCQSYSLHFSLHLLFPFC